MFIEEKNNNIKGKINNIKYINHNNNFLFLIILSFSFFSPIFSKSSIDFLISKNSSSSQKSYFFILKIKYYYYDLCILYYLSCL
jgi:hypothetical protein